LLSDPPLLTQRSVASPAKLSFKIGNSCCQT
jgi:hypothetical protein